jgi:hypothetical protein
MSFDEDPRNDEPIDREEWEKAMSPKPPESDASPTKKVMCPYCKHDDCIYTGDDVWYCNKCDKGHFESKASRLEQLEAIVRELANMIRPHFLGYPRMIQTGEYVQSQSMVATEWYEEITDLIRRSRELQGAKQ